MRSWSKRGAVTVRGLAAVGVLAALVWVLMPGVPEAGRDLLAQLLAQLFSTTGTAVTDNVILRGDGTTVIQGSLDTIDDNGGIDAPAHPTLGGKLTLKEGADDGTNIWSLALPDTGVDRDTARVLTNQGGLPIWQPRVLIDGVEDFFTEPNTSAGKGPLGLLLNGVGVVCVSATQQAAPDYNHPGVVRFTGGALNGNGCAARTAGSTNATVFGLPESAQGWYGEAILKLNTNTVQAAYIGSGTTAANPPGEFIGIRFNTSADGTTFRCVGCTGGVCSTTDMGVTADTAFHYFKWEHDPAAAQGTSQIKCTVDGTTVAGVTTNVPAPGGGMRPVNIVQVTLENVAKTMDIDMVHFFLPVNR